MGRLTQTPRASALALELGCCDSLSWRCDLEQPDQDVDRVEAGLLERGFVSRCRDSRLRVLRHCAGHEVVIVRATGRVQVRVDIETPRERRKEKALTLYDMLLQSLAEE